MSQPECGWKHWVDGVGLTEIEVEALKLGDKMIMLTVFDCTDEDKLAQQPAGECSIRIAKTM